jgi:hypothetical protein
MIPESLLSQTRAWLAHPRAWLAVQASALILLTFGLVDIMSGSRRDLFLGAILGGICALWLTQQPHWGALIILAVWITNVDVFESTPYLVSAVLLLPFGLTVLRDRQIWVLRVPQVRILLIIGIIFLISTWWSEFKYPVSLFPEKDQTVRQMQVFATRLVWLTFFLYFINTRQKIELATWIALGLVVAAASSAAPASLLKGGDISRAEAGFSLAENSNRLAYISIFATTLFWYYRFDGPASRWRNWTLPFIVCLPLIALATGSRSGFLQIGILALLLVKDQRGWAPAKRILCIFFMGFVALFLSAIVPATNLMRATTFDPNVVAPGQTSLQNRLLVVFDALKMFASDPIFGAGIGNFPWVARAYFQSNGQTHNSYLWALVSGGIGTLALYLLLFFITYGMLREAERSAPRELLWLSKGLRVNLILFMLFSAFADFWLSDFLYLFVGLAVALNQLPRVQEPRSVPISRQGQLGQSVSASHW